MLRKDAWLAPGPLSSQRPAPRAPPLQELATPLLLTNSADAGNVKVVGDAATAATAVRRCVAAALCFQIPPVVGDDCDDGLLKDLVDTLHLLAAALHVLGVHLRSDGHALLAGDGGEALGLEHVDAGFLKAQVGLEADENQGGVGAEVKDFGVPL